MSNSINEWSAIKYVASTDSSRHIEDYLSWSILAPFGDIELGRQAPEPMLIYHQWKSVVYTCKGISLGIALKFDRHTGGNAADVPVNFQSDFTNLNTNSAASRLHEILKLDVYQISENFNRAQMASASHILL